MVEHLRKSEYNEFMWETIIKFDAPIVNDKR